ncbi:MAG TPA: dihydroorotate dehydrogenase [Verrucomicrobiae bacterium]|nr:dihydroorotate dehydrogenase [Verrucomicrobiae bacterium]
MTMNRPKQKNKEAKTPAAVDMTCRIKDLVFKNPVTVASGTFGTKDEYTSCVDYEKLGAVITKTITVKPRRGNPMPRICETPSGMLNAIGLQNKGLEDFIENKIPYFAGIKTPLIVNIAGEEENDFEILVKALHAHKKVVKALEINLSCPNVEAGGVSGMKKKEKIEKIIKTVRGETDLPIVAKLSPELGDVIEIAGEVLRAGADGLSLINTLKGLAVNIRTRQPRIANVTGGLSGPAIRPVALRYVYEVKKNYQVPVIASGGILTADDAMEFIIVGADLIALGTANFVNPTATMDVLRGIETFCRNQGIMSLSQIRGTFHVPPRQSCWQ